ncbi:MAG: hypothetical protein ACRDOO_23915 [Actinomadura sp.]
MPIPHLGSLARLAALAVIPIALSGCGGDAEATSPHTDQAGHLLKVQTYKFFFATTLSEVKVTDELFDKYVPCGENRFKLTYAVAGRPASFATTNSGNIRSASDKAVESGAIIDDLARFVPTVGTFTVAERKSGDPTLKLDNAKTNTHLTLHSPEPNRLVISGETDCLRKPRVQTH